MTKISDLHRRWSTDRGYKDAYDALAEEFDLARALIEARTAAGLSQSQLRVRHQNSTERGIAFCCTLGLDTARGTTRRPRRSKLPGAAAG